MSIAPSPTSTDVRSRRAGRLYLDVDHYDTHSVLTVWNGTTPGTERVPGLENIRNADESEFTAIYRMIASAADNGTSGEDIALLYAQDIAEQELAKAEREGDVERQAQLRKLIPTLMTAEQRELAGRFDAALKALDEIKVDDRAPSLAALRDKHNADRHYEIKTIRATATRKPTTDAQRRLFEACAQSDTGSVKVGEHLAATMRAAWRNGMGELLRGGNARFEVVGFVANARALKEVGV